MKGKEQESQRFYSGTFLRTILQYRKHLLIIGIITVFLASLFSSSYFITPLYKSYVILYPTASNSISKVLLSSNFNNSKDILEFGEDEKTEQMLQVLNSNRIRDRIIQKFDLAKHYGIKPGSKYHMTRLYDIYQNNFRFRRTKYMAVKIIVYDKDPQLASDMANDVSELLDSTINTMQKVIAVKAFNIVQTAYSKLRDEITAKEDSLTKLRELGINDYESQAEMFNRQLAISMAKGNTTSVQRLQQKLDTLSKYGGPYVSLRDGLEYDKKQLSELKAKYEEAKVDATESLPHKFVISRAYKAEKKSYPIRWLIVVISLLSVWFLSILIIGVFNMGKEIRKEEKNYLHNANGK